MTTQTGIPITLCMTCGRTHPVTRGHCLTCGSPSVFVDPDSELCLNHRSKTEPLPGQLDLLGEEA